MKAPLAPVLAALLGLAGVLAPAVPAAAAGIDDSGKALAKIDDSWSESSVRRDVDLLASFYADDAVVYPPSDVMFSGRPAARKYWAAAFADPTYALTWKTLSASISKSGDLGFTAGTYAESYKGTDGKMVRNTGKYVAVWTKDKDGAWKCIHDIWNADK